MGEKHPYYGKSMSTNFPGSAHAMGFVILSRAMGYLWENSNIFRMIKYIKEWNLMERRTYTMGKLWELIFQILPVRWILLHFPMLWKIYEKTQVLLMWRSVPKDGNLMEKSTRTMERAWLPISIVSPIWQVLLHFHVLWRDLLFFSCVTRFNYYADS